VCEFARANQPGTSGVGDSSSEDWSACGRNGSTCSWDVRFSGEEVAGCRAGARYSGLAADLEGYDCVVRGFIGEPLVEYGMELKKA